MHCIAFLLGLLALAALQRHASYGSLSIIRFGSAVSSGQGRRRMEVERLKQEMKLNGQPSSLLPCAKWIV